MAESSMIGTEAVLQPCKYTEQELQWPTKGRVILAKYDEECVVVYQAFKPEIAEYAVEHQRFGGPHFSFERMSWIKTNFLWMMYRCGWATKRYQERVLAVRITHEGFKEILRHAYSAQRSKAENVGGVRVRLQWDPDHTPSYEKCQRRAVQLGLKKEILQKYSTDWVRSITDITDFVMEQHKNVNAKTGHKDLLVPSETVYEITDQDLIKSLDMDVTDEHAANQKTKPKTTFKRRGNKNRN